MIPPRPGRRPGPTAELYSAAWRRGSDALSSACARSSIRSSTSSRPTDSRKRPGAMPSAARCSGFRRWWVVVSGWVMRLLASPRLFEMPMIVERVGHPERRRLAAGDFEREHRAAAAPSAAGRARPADDRRGRDRACARPRDDRSGSRRSAPPTRVCAATRTGSVSSDFRSVQALNGDRLGPVWRRKL